MRKEHFPEKRYCSLVLSTTDRNRLVVFLYKVGKKPFRSEYFNRTVDKYASELYNYDIKHVQIRTLNEFRKEFGIEWKELK